MKTVIESNQAPIAIGPYSQAVMGAGIIFTSGQLPVDPATNELATGGIEEQTRQALKNLQSVLRAANSDLGKVLKCTVFLKDIKDFSAMNRVYGEFFGSCDNPARSAFQVAALPKDALVEIEAVALAD